MGSSVSPEVQAMADDLLGDVTLDTLDDDSSGSSTADSSTDNGDAGATASASSATDPNAGTDTKQGRARDEAGKFVKQEKDAKAAAATASAATEGQTTRAAANPVAATTDAALPIPTTDTPVTAPPEPLKFGYGRISYPIPGSYMDPNGNAVIPKAHVEKALKLLGEGLLYQSKARQELGTLRSTVQRMTAEQSTAATLEKVSYDARQAELDAILDNDPDALVNNREAVKLHLNAVSERAVMAKKLELAEKGQLFSGPKAVTDDPTAGITREVVHREIDSILDEAADFPDYGPALRGPHGKAIEARLKSVDHVFLMRDGKFNVELFERHLAQEVKFFAEQDARVSAEQKRLNDLSAATRRNAANAPPITNGKKPVAAKPVARKQDEDRPTVAVQRDRARDFKRDFRRMDPMKDEDDE